MTEVAGWVWTSNVQAAVELIALTVGYAVDESDTQAVLLGVEQPKADVQRWYTYPLVGDPAVEVHFARNPGASPVAVKVTGPMDDIQQAKVDTILTVLAHVEGRT